MSAANAPQTDAFCSPSLPARKLCASCGRAFVADEPPLGTPPIANDSDERQLIELPRGPLNVIELPDGAVTFITDSPVNGGLLHQFKPSQATVSDPSDGFYWPIMIILCGLVFLGIKYWAEQSIVFLHDLLSPEGIDLTR